ncbi:MAG: hypothetical protein IKB73_04205 [Ruminococcus sp.]|nr:hypothetical protein [Ruminococcus sp.]
MNQNSRSKNSIKNASSEIVVRLLTAGSKFALRTVFIYTLGIQYNGVSGLFNDILFMFSLAELGINRAIAFALYKPLANKDDDAIARIMKFYKIVYRIIAGVIMLLGLAMLPFLKYLVKDVPDIKESIYVIFILFVIQSASSYLFIYKATLLEANQEKRIVSYVNIAATIIQVVCESLILIVFREYLMYLVFSIVFTLSKNIFISYITERKFPVLKRKDVGPLTKEEAKQIKADIGATAIYNVSNVAVQTTDTIVTAAFFPTTIVGILSNYRLITNTLNTLISQISASCVPSIGNLAVTATKEKLHQLHDRLSFIMFMIGNFVCAALIGLLNPFISDIWLDLRYIFFMPTIVVIVFNLYLCIMQYPNTAYRNSNGLFVQGRLRPAIMAVINVVLAVTFGTIFSKYGQQWGVFGILLAAPISRLLTETWFDPYVVYKHVFNMPMKKYFLKRFCYFSVMVISCVATHFCIGQILGALDVSNVYIAFVLRGICACFVPNVIMLLLFFRTSIFKESVGMVLSTILKRK